MNQQQTALGTEPRGTWGRTTGHIVVGVDGSWSSKAALAWAATQARLTGSRLVVVSTWHFPMNYGWMPPWPENLDLATDRKMALADDVAEVLGTDPEIDATTEVIEGHPAHVLTELSKTASLIVVGCRGHGEVAGMLLGSVSEYLTAHAHCAVVVVRDHEDRDTSA
jgi:nucleotide-binding universal stress UspA family protein